MGFAVPIDIAKSELPQLEAGRAPEHADLGGVGSARRRRRAARPAARGGIRAGDVIVKVGAESISGVNDLVTAASGHEPGDRVAVAVVRRGKPLTRSVTLAKEPSTVATAG